MENIEDWCISRQLWWGHQVPAWYHKETGEVYVGKNPPADFVDVVILGEGEEVNLEVVNEYKEWKKNKTTREDFLYKISSIEGVYIPSFYDVKYNEDGTVQSVTPNRDGITKNPTKRIIKDVETVDYPEKLIVPYIDTVHDRIVLELFRGCTRGCIFIYQIISQL